MVALRPHRDEQEQLADLPELVPASAPFSTSTYRTQVVMRNIFDEAGSFGHDDTEERAGTGISQCITCILRATPSRSIIESRTIHRRLLAQGNSLEARATAFPRAFWHVMARSNFQRVPVLVPHRADHRPTDPTPLIF
jgi:hypothetical protein